MAFRGSQFESSTGLFLGVEDVPHATSITVRWGAHNGNVIFPGDWYNFYGNSFSAEVPKLSAIPNSTYLFQTELFTINSQSRKTLFAVQGQSSNDSFDLLEVGPADFDHIIAAFWETYHGALRKLKKQG